MYKFLILILLAASVIAAPVPVSAQDDETPCPTDRAMWIALQFTDITPVFTGEGVSWDHCKWNWQANNILDMGITLSLPENWQATVTTLPDGEVSVWRGPATIEEVVGFTLRFVSTYEETHWVHDDCALLAQESSFGLRRDPSYLTVNGNLECEALEEFDPEVCPTAPEAVAALVGGLPNQWTAPDWDLGAWIFQAPEDEFILLQIPQSLTEADEVVHIDYWDGEAETPASLAPGDRGLSLNEASFHCHAEEE